MEITWIGVGIGLLVTGAVLFSYRLGLEVGKSSSQIIYVDDEGWEQWD